jgi:hypothetical protein
MLLGFEHYVALDWSKQTMAVAHMSPRSLHCNPYRNRLLSDGPKTDKVDAVKLCQLLRTGLLKEVYESAGEAPFILRHRDTALGLYDATKKQYEQRFQELSTDILFYRSRPVHRNEA